jgi:hypothetical protein
VVVSSSDSNYHIYLSPSLECSPVSRIGVVWEAALVVVVAITRLNYLVNW